MNRLCPRLSKRTSRRWLVTCVVVLIVPPWPVPRAQLPAGEVDSLQGTYQHLVQVRLRASTCKHARAVPREAFRARLLLPIRHCSRVRGGTRPWRCAAQECLTAGRAPDGLLLALSDLYVHARTLLNRLAAQANAGVGVRDAPAPPTSAGAPPSRALPGAAAGEERAQARAGSEWTPPDQFRRCERGPWMCLPSCVLGSPCAAAVEHGSVST